MSHKVKSRQMKLKNVSGDLGLVLEDSNVEELGASSYSMLELQ